MGTDGKEDIDVAPIGVENYEQATLRGPSPA
jgi:hypothetical protein